ncbi:LiaI-LiaF-like domain-containing protein [Tumebacillus flagellatus]|uniref:LiaI-LiaF-like transmembrane region domain-containing protein n=1 Tax=Tumebacillus flagellatus TaxID=1157490 RepID=A0A074LM10_9BACL|nr:DUF5668 domain-containing protein [Tumebacillus flagellatus]KEO81580.1 hypothetical protein EL26_20055 [Tumebacillus flagellatus]
MERRFAGVMLLVVGAVLALGALGLITISMYYLWPLFMIVPGILFHVRFFMFGGRDPGVLVPGGVLTVIGCLFLFCNLFGWGMLHGLWPIFVLAPAVGLFELYLFGGRNPGLLVPVTVLTLVAVVFLGFNALNGMFGGILGLVLVGVGAWVLFGRGGKKKDSFF